MDNTEQWLTDGNCDVCRRRKYCSKECRAAKAATRRLISGLATKVMIDCMRSAGKASHDARISKG